MKNVISGTAKLVIWVASKNQIKGVDSEDIGVL